jgi:hypothetical protein
MGRWGKNKCAANVCRHLCVGIAALLFLRSVGCIVMLVVLVSVEIMNCRHSMTHNDRVLQSVGILEFRPPVTAAEKSYFVEVKR